MGRRLCVCGVTRPTLSLVLMALLLSDPIWALGKKGGGSKTSGSSSSSKTSYSSHNKPSSTSPRTPKTQPRQPSQGGGQQPKKDPYPKGGHYPGAGTNTNQQNPGRGGGTYGGNTNQQYPNQGGQYPNQGRNTNPQYPGQGGTNYGGQPNQYPGQGGTNYGRNPNQPYPGQPNPPYPGQGGQPYQPYPGQGGTNYGRNPYQPYQPGQGGTNYGRNPNPGWGQGGGYGQGYGGGYGYGGGGYGGGYGYPNQNPNNKILSPRYGGGFMGGGHGGMGGGSPFAHSVQKHGYQPSMKSKGFAKKAMLAAGVGAVAGMAVGYGIGRFPRPHFGFNSPMEEQQYNRYMYERYGSKSTDQNDYREYVYKTPPKNVDKNFQTYEQYMDSCMNRTDLLKQGDSSGPEMSHLQNDQPPNTAEHRDSDQSNPQSEEPPNNPASSLEPSLLTKPPPIPAADYNTDGTPSPPSLSDKDATVTTLSPVIGGRGKRADDSDDRVVSIAEIGYPALMNQLKSRRCMELYMVYSEKYLQKAETQQQDSNNNNSNNPRGRGGDTSHWGRPLVLLFTTTIMLLCSNILLQ